MKACHACEQQNHDEAKYCSQCGAKFSDSPTEPTGQISTDEAQLWKTFIGPNKSIQFSLNEGWAWKPAYVYYLDKFQNFKAGSGSRFALTWHWPAFLFDPFLWFLYRKMYLYALVYAVGPVVSALMTGDMTVGVIWRIVAGASANYIYFWQVKDYLIKIQRKVGVDHLKQIQFLREEGGAQPYVIWLGAALHFLLLGVILAAFQDGLETEEPVSPPEQEEKQKFF